MHQRRSRRVIGASATGSALTSGPTPRQRRPVKAIAVTRPQLRTRHSHREIKRQFCKIVGGVLSPLLAEIRAERAKVEAEIVDTRKRHATLRAEYGAAL